MRDYLNRLTKDTIIYGIGNIAAKGISFFLLPVYTRIFLPTEYGTIEMLLVIIGLLGSILNMGTDSAQSFYFFKERDRGKAYQSNIITSILQWRIVSGIILVFIAMLLAPLLNNFFFNGELTLKHFAISFLAALFFQLLRQNIEVFRLLYRPWDYIFISFIQSFLSAGLTIALVLYFDLSVLGYFIGFGVGTLIAAIYGWWKIRDYLSFSISRSDLWRQLLKFGLPFVPTGLAMYVLNTADRWFISYFIGQDILGIYAVASKFALILYLSVVTFRRAWQPIALDAIHSEEGPDLLRFIARLYFGVGLAIVVMFNAIAPYLVRFFTAPQYHHAGPIIGVLSWYAIFYGFQLIISLGIWKREKTFLAPIGMFVAVIINIALDYWLVPRWGAMGAAFATSVSFLIWNFVTLFISERIWYVGYPFKIFLMQLLLSVSACSLILFIYDNDFSHWYVYVISLVSIVILLISSLERDKLNELYTLIRKNNKWMRFWKQ